MIVSETALPGVLVIEPRVFEDERGSFMETFQAQRYAEAGIAGPFVQDNVSRSGHGVLRGLHLQHPQPQAKLIWVDHGAIYDVAVDLRVGSPTFGAWFGLRLAADDHRQVYIPGGFAHGFCVIGEGALVSYKCTEVYAPECELAVRWNDPDIGIEWPLESPRLSPRDAAAPRLAEIERGRLPEYRESP